MQHPRDLPLLAILPQDKLLLHEKHDHQRSPHLMENLRSSGVLRNPPIVSPLHDRTGRYAVLDGAHRTLVLQAMDLPHVLAQVVEPDDPGLGLSPWNHVIWNWDSGQFLHSIQGIPYVSVTETDQKQANQEMASRTALVQISVPSGQTYIVTPPTQDLLTRVLFLNTIVDRYKDQAMMDRTKISDMQALSRLYPQLTGLIVLPYFRIEEVLYLAGVGQMLPTGSTRFTISPRALHVNYPLAELESSKTLEEKDASLQRWLQERLAHKGVRYYAEATYLFDE